MEKRRDMVLSLKQKRASLALVIECQQFNIQPTMIPLIKDVGQLIRGRGGAKDSTLTTS